MKSLAKRVEFVDGAVVVVGGCVSCDGDLVFPNPPPLRIEVPARCAVEGCGKEIAVAVRSRESAAVRIPYGCSAWFDVRSSNLAAVGRLRSDLVVRFRSGGVYRVPNGGKFLKLLLAADSPGRTYHARVKPLGAVRLCAAYGCANPADVAANQVLCRNHLESHRR